jgi:hypothetical protein
VRNGKLDIAAEGQRGMGCLRQLRVVRGDYGRTAGGTVKLLLAEVESITALREQTGSYALQAPEST